MSVVNHAAFHETRGMSVFARTTSHGGWTTNAVTT